MTCWLDWAPGCRPASQQLPYNLVAAFDTYWTTKQGQTSSLSLTWCIGGRQASWRTPGVSAPLQASKRTPSVSAATNCEDTNHLPCLCLYCQSTGCRWTLCKHFGKLCIVFKRKKLNGFRSWYKHTITSYNRIRYSHKISIMKMWTARFRGIGWIPYYCRERNKVYFYTNLVKSVGSILL